jgi:cholesterol oxidase
MSGSTRADAVAVRFTEEMKGYLALGETDYEAGSKRGEADGTFVMFHLTIEIPDMDRFMDDPMRAGVCTGWVGADVLGGRLPVVRGDFNLFVDLDGGTSRKEMRYRLWFHDGVGHPLTLVGFKDVDDDRGFDVWSDTSTLYTRILHGHVEPGDDDSAEILGSGIITIWIRDFAKQLTTFRASGPTWRARFRGIGMFGGVFLTQLKQVYLGRAKRTQET